MVTGGAGINWDGVVSLTGVNNGEIPGFIDELNGLGTWTTKKISMYISSTSKYLDYNNVDSSQIDSGGPWQITNKVNNFFRFHLYSVQSTNGSEVTVDVSAEFDYLNNAYIGLPTTPFTSFKTSLEAAYNKTCTVSNGLISCPCSSVNDFGPIYMTFNELGGTIPQV